MGNPGNVKPVGEGVSELRIDYGPGYRVYFKKKGKTVIVLLAGGDKRTQRQDIRTALRLAPCAQFGELKYEKDQDKSIRCCRASQNS